MSLSDSERRSFEELEAQLRESDPQFARKISNASSFHGKMTTRNIVIGSLILIAGVVLLLAGISTSLTILGVLGFVIMGAGVYFATTKAGTSATSSGSGRNGGKAKSTSPFMKRLEDAWEERRRQEGR
jgi:predicted lipid-binding transport protein (Tim44 family)